MSNDSVPTCRSALEVNIPSSSTPLASDGDATSAKSSAADGNSANLRHVRSPIVGQDMFLTIDFCLYIRRDKKEYLLHSCPWQNCGEEDSCVVLPTPILTFFWPCFPDSHTFPALSSFPLFSYPLLSRVLSLTKLDFRRWCFFSFFLVKVRSVTVHYKSRREWLFWMRGVREKRREREGRGRSDGFSWYGFQRISIRCGGESKVFP